MVLKDPAARTILIVDDNVDLANLVRKYLAREGYRVVSCAAAAEAVAWLDQGRADLVLLDLDLSDQGGAAVVDRLCQRGREIPFIVIAAHGGERRAVEMMKAGAIDYLMKDATLLQLLPAVVTQALTQLDRQRKLTDAEFALQHLRTHYELILNAVGEGVCGLDMEGRITFVNPAGLRMLGYQGADLIGQDLAILADQPGGSPPGMMLDVAASSTFRSHDQVFWRKDGTSFPIDYTSTPIRANGRQVGCVFVFRDIARRKALEEQVTQWQRLEAVGRLAGAIAHDFNNLLTVISGYTDLLHNQPAVDDRGRLMIGEIRDATERAITLTRQLLAFGQKQELRPRRIHLARFFANLKPIVQRLLGPEIVVTEAIDPATSSFQADPEQLEQVFLNLAVNAKEAMPEGGRLAITAQNMVVVADDSAAPAGLAPGSYVLITLADTGPMRTAAELDSAFDPVMVTRDNRHGLGLGLATVYGIMQQSGGHIEVDDLADRGTAFRLYFPRTEEDSAARSPSANGPLYHGDETVLIVAENAAVRSLTARVLRERGYQVLEASHPDEGEQMVVSAKGAVDLVVADDGATTGAGAIAKLRALAADMPAVRLTNSIDGARPAENPSRGVTLVAKPFTSELLARAVRHALDNHVSALQ